jgi:type III pantothenate kinase
VLLIDVGNSRCKWACIENGVQTQHGVTGNTEWLALQQSFAALPLPSRIIASNVGGEAMAQRLRALCDHWAVPIEFVVASGEQCGVRNSYEQPERLGSDRWAALIAAWRRMQRACLVVNCGTATTVDALSASGEFLGGLILPGVTLMQQSLLHNAAQLKDVEGRLQDFPRNTADAIHSGVLRATLGAIQHQYALLGEGGGCVLSGGAAQQIQAYLGMPVERVDNLVLEGLHIILLSRD